MNYEEQMEILERFREDLHQQVDVRINQMIQQMSLEKEILLKDSLEMKNPLTAYTGIFKGKKAVAVEFSDGSVCRTPTWKKVVEVILKDCISNDTYHNRLLDIRGKVYGKQRVLLAEKPEQMNVPIKIEEGLYFEGKFDTETLLSVLTNRILDAVGYSYQGLQIHYQFPKIQMEEEQPEQQTEEQAQSVPRMIM